MKQRTVVHMATYTIVVALAVAISVAATGSWLPGLPLGVLAAIAISALVGSWIGRRSIRESRGGNDSTEQ